MKAYDLMMINCNLAVGRMRKGSALDPLKPFLEKGFENPKNFQKRDTFHQFSPTK